MCRLENVCLTTVRDGLTQAGAIVALTASEAEDLGVGVLAAGPGFAAAGGAVRGPAGIRRAS